MDLKDIAAVSGKSGLYKVVKPTRTGLILETLDEAKSRLIAGATNKVSLLNEISVFTTGEEVSASLATVLINIHKKYGNTIPIDTKASNNELFSFLGEVLPEFDREKVYPSDIKKLVNWYGLLAKHAPEKFVEEEPKAEKVKEVAAEDKKPAHTEKGSKTEAKKEEPKGEVKETAAPEVKKPAAKKEEIKEEVKEAETKKAEKPKAKKEKSHEAEAGGAEEEGAKKPKAAKQPTKK